MICKIICNSNFSVLKVLLGHSHAHSFHVISTATAGVSSCHKNYMATKLNIYNLALCRKSLLTPGLDDLQGPCPCVLLTGVVCLL